MANPIVPQGVLNRVIASISFPDFPGLNITASYLGREGISLSFEGAATTPIETMVGVVQSPEPYQRVAFAAHLLKTQALATNFKAQLESSTLLGDGVTIRPDVPTPGITPYQIDNVAINNVSTLKFDGTDAGWVIMFSGIYYINANLFNT